MPRHSPTPRPRISPGTRRSLYVVAGIAAGAAAPFTVFQQFALAGNSAPVPTNVDLSTFVVTANDGFTAYVRNPSLSLTTSIDKQIVASGSTLNFTYTVLDNGDTGFKDVVVQDDKCSPITGGASVLAPGEKTVFTCSTTVTTDETHAAKVSGTPVLASASAPSNPAPSTPAPEPSTSSPAPAPSTSSPAPAPSTSTPPPAGSGLKDGTYTGAAVNVTVPDANETYQVQVQAVISGGQITAITMPVHTETDLTSKNIVKFNVATNAALNNDPSNPTMIYEAITGQTAKIATISGATYTTKGFTASLADALAQAAA